jgi:putative addiction module component (TIGR02574 family)
MSADQIIAAALALPPEAKAKLIDKLLGSLDGPEQHEIDAAWAEEVERRIDALDRGTATTVPAEQALRDARARLKS